MTKLPDKLEHQLREFLKDKFVDEYIKGPAAPLYDMNTPLALGSGMVTTYRFKDTAITCAIVDTTKSVTLIKRRMLLSDLDYKSSDSQAELKYLFDLEKKAEKLDRLTGSISELKGVFNNFK